MKKIFALTALLLSVAAMGYGQVGSIKAETYQADFEKKQSIEDVIRFMDHMVIILVKI